MAPPDLGSRCEGGSPGGGRPPARGPCAAAWRGAGGAASGVHGKSGFRPPLVAPCLRGRPALKPAALLPRRGGVARRAIVRVRAPGRAGARSDARRDAQAGVPSAGRPRAQLAFKDSMVRGILQFTPSIAFRYVLHRCESRDIRCRESFRYMYDRCWVGRSGRAPRGRGRGALRAVRCSLAPAGAGVVCPRPGGAAGVSLDDGVRGSCVSGLDNDPSAGSPTETLLRLLLPLNDKVQWTSRDVAGGGPPPSPRSEHFTGPFNR